MDTNLSLPTGDGETDVYFKSYEDCGVHRLMLEDKPRTEAYRNAILSSAINFKDKIIMDVGAGTGILSLFCAKVGVKKVYAVEASNLALTIKDIVKENKLEDTIEVLHCRAEDVSEEIQVDIIISEWMGFFLLHESMIDSVICARDKHLKPGGLMYPEKASLYCSPCSTPNLLNFWDDVYGFKMTAMKDVIRKSLAIKPEITTLKSEDLLNQQTHKIHTFDMNIVSVYDVVQLSSKVFISTDKAGVYQAVSVWFDVEFPTAQLEGDDKEGIKLSTSPEFPPTHWQQTVIVWPEDQAVEEGDILAFEIEFQRNGPESRKYNIHLKELDAAEDEHPVPCSCGIARCNIIQAFLLQNDEESDISSENDEENMPSVSSNE